MQISSKIGFRLSLGFLIILLILVSVTLFAINKMDTLFTQTENIYDHPLTVSNAVLRINVNIIKMHRTMTDIVHDEGEGIIKEDAQLVNELEAEVLKDFEIINERFLGKMETYEDALNLFKAWKPIRDEIISLMLNGEVEQAVTINRGKCARHIVKIEKAVEALGHFAQGKAKEFLDSAINTKDLSFTTMYFVLAIAILLSILLAALFTLSITNPISAIKETIEAVGSGVTNAKISLKSKDELGDLANSFNSMMSNLSEVTASRDELNKEIVERKKVEESLRESEARFKAMFEQAAVGVAYMNSVTGEFVRVNQRYADILGYTVKELESTNFQKITHPDDLHIDLDNVEKLRKGEISEFFAVKRYYRKDEDIVWVKIAAAPLWKPGDQPTFHVTVVEDITKQKGAEEALKLSEELLKKSQEIGHIGSWHLDIKKYILKWSDEQYRIFGYSPQTFGATYEAFLEAVHPDDRERVNKTYTEAIERNIPYECVHRVLRPDGEIRTVLEKSEDIVDENGNTVHSFGMTLDITEQEIFERKDQIYKRYAQNVASSTGIGFMNNITKFLANELGFEYCLIGRLMPENMVRTVSLYAKEELAENIEYSLDDTPCRNVMGRNICIYNREIQSLFPKDELLVQMGVQSYAGIPLFNSTGEPIGIVVVLGERELNKEEEPVLSELIQVFGSRASSELESLEYQEALIEKTHQKEMLIKEVHHRVKNNLSIIQSLLSLQSSQSKDASAKYALDESQNRVRAMSMIHERLYKSSDLSTLDFSDYISDLANQLFENYCTNKQNITINVDIPKVSIDIDTIIPCGLIMNELITNSIKYAFPDGRKGIISVKGEYDELDQMFMIVRDNGIGLPDGFDISASDSLGMKIVQSLSSQIGSDVQIHSDKNGTEFKVMLIKATMKSVDWDDKLHMMGHEVIDKQHKQLYDAIDSLKYAIESGRHEEGISEIIPALLYYVDEHFKTEERLMTEYKYPDYDSHKKHHADFKRKINEFVWEIRDGKRGLSLSVYDCLIEWLIDHLGNVDKRLAAFMKGKGLLSTVASPNKKAKSYQILTIEDDKLAQMTMSRFLQKNGYSYLIASNGRDALRKIADNNFELIISDVMLPDIEGIEVIRHARKSGNDTPVFFLTGKDVDDISERLSGLNVLGVLPKPVSFPDLKKVLSDYFEE